MVDDPTPEIQADEAGTLADAIAAHIALKREHGDDSSASAEAGATPDSDLAVDEPVVEIASEPAVIQPEVTSEPEPEPLTAEPAAELPDPEPASAPIEPEHFSPTIEFEFGDVEPEPEPSTQRASTVDHDLLEDVPDFFEETPQHDKLWFDEAPPRKFDF